MVRMYKQKKSQQPQYYILPWGFLLQKYNNTDDIVLGTTVSGRNVDMVGLFINTLPLRVRSIENENIQSLLKKVECILKERDEYQANVSSIR